MLLFLFSPFFCCVFCHASRWSRCSQRASKCKASGHCSAFPHALMAALKLKMLAVRPWPRDIFVAWRCDVLLSDDFRCSGEIGNCCMSWSVEDIDIYWHIYLGWQASNDLTKHDESFFPRCCFLTCADDSIVRDHIGSQALSCLLQYPQRHQQRYTIWKHMETVSRNLKPIKHMSDVEKKPLELCDSSEHKNVTTPPAMPKLTATCHSSQRHCWLYCRKSWFQTSDSSKGGKWKDVTKLLLCLWKSPNKTLFYARMFWTDRSDGGPHLQNFNQDSSLAATCYTVHKRYIEPKSIEMLQHMHSSMNCMWSHPKIESVKICSAGSRQPMPWDVRYICLHRTINKKTPMNVPVPWRGWSKIPPPKKLGSSFLNNHEAECLLQNLPTTSSPSPWQLIDRRIFAAPNVGGFFPNPSEKSAPVKLDHFPR